MTDVLRAAINSYPGTRYRLAALSGVSQPQIDRFASGERSLRLDIAEKIARTLGLALVQVSKPLLEK